MKIALYHPWIYLHGGIERTIMELVTRSRHDWVIYTGHYNPAGVFPKFASLDVHELKRTSVDRSIVNVLRSAIQVASQKLPLAEDVDAVLVMCDGIGDFIALRNTSVPIFNLCFTPLRAAFDSKYEMAAKANLDIFMRGLYNTFKYLFCIADRLMWRRYHNVFAISGEVERRIVAGKLRAQERITRACPGIDMPTDLDDLAYEPFILVAGRIMWTKNIQLAIEAFKRAKLPSPWRLVIAGFVDKKSEVYLDELRKLAGDEAVEFLLCPTDEIISDLNRRAAFSLFTPLNEDFGLTPLESMAHAKLVIANNSGGPCETITHGRSGYLMNPHADEWAALIADLVENPELIRTLGTQAQVDVQRFTLDRFINVIDSAFDGWLTSDTEKAVGHTNQVISNSDVRSNGRIKATHFPLRRRRLKS